MCMCVCFGVVCVFVCFCFVFVCVCYVCVCVFILVFVVFCVYERGCIGVFFLTVIVCVFCVGCCVDGCDGSNKRLKLDSPIVSDDYRESTMRNFALVGRLQRCTACCPEKICKCEKSVTEKVEEMSSVAKNCPSIKTPESYQPSDFDNNDLGPPVIVLSEGQGAPPDDDPDNTGGISEGQGAPVYGDVSSDPSDPNYFESVSHETLRLEFEPALDDGNVIRLSEGHPALLWDDHLATAAHRHACDMADRGYNSHIALAPAPNGAGVGARVLDTGFVWTTVAEGITGTMAGSATSVDAYNLFKSEWNDDADFSNDGHYRPFVTGDHTSVGVAGCDGVFVFVYGSGAAVLDAPVLESRQPELGSMPSVNTDIGTGTHDVIMAQWNGVNAVPVLTNTVENDLLSWTGLSNENDSLVINGEVHRVVGAQDVSRFPWDGDETVPDWYRSIQPKFEISPINLQAGLDFTVTISYGTQSISSSFVTSAVGVFAIGTDVVMEPVFDLGGDFVLPATNLDDTVDIPGVDITTDIVFNSGFGQPVYVILKAFRSAARQAQPTSNVGTLGAMMSTLTTGSYTTRLAGQDIPPVSGLNITANFLFRNDAVDPWPNSNFFANKRWNPMIMVSGHNNVQGKETPSDPVSVSLGDRNKVTPMMWLYGDIGTTITPRLGDAGGGDPSFAYFYYFHKMRY